ncbi:RNA-binding protein BRN2-like [Lolium rigidum]|uniref:RNA-binding protein BRN2-like n=1 Tax=Lolium rigidum TaxID=89674 RepID=UPI001F5E2148|nr:RNA-binding protein BRN2-like [Lolium rigidum]
MEESAIKLFVGQVPKLMTEVEQAAMFCDVAIINEVTVIRDTATKILRGGGDAKQPGAEQPAREPALEVLERLQAGGSAVCKLFSNFC